MRERTIKVTAITARAANELWLLLDDAAQSMASGTPFPVFRTDL